VLRHVFEIDGLQILLLIYDRLVFAIRLVGGARHEHVSLVLCLGQVNEYVPKVEDSSDTDVRGLVHFPRPSYDSNPGCLAFRVLIFERLLHFFLILCNC
jgi:hypothetical protein